MSPYSQREPILLEDTAISLVEDKPPEESALSSTSDDIVVPSRRCCGSAYDTGRWFSNLKNVVSRQISGLYAAVLYGLCSSSMAFVNKTLLSSYDFKFPFSIMVAQMSFMLIVLFILSAFGLVTLPTLTITRCSEFLLPSIFYATNSVLGLLALTGMNIPMYGVIKRMVPLAILVFGMLILKKGLPSKLVVSAVVTMTLGCIIAGYGDLSFNIGAYVCGLASSVTQGLYLVLVQKQSEIRSTVETLLLNSVNTLPLLITMALVNKEPSRILHNENFLIFNGGFLLVFLLTISMGCLLNYSLFLCTSVNSALTTSVVGSIKSILQTVVGLFTFGGIALNIATVTGIVMNLTGGVIYSFAKYRSSVSETLTRKVSYSEIRPKADDNFTSCSKDSPSYHRIDINDSTNRELY